MREAEIGRLSVVLALVVVTSVANALVLPTPVNISNSGAETPSTTGGSDATDIFPGWTIAGPAAANKWVTNLAFAAFNVPAVPGSTRCFGNVGTGYNDNQVPYITQTVSLATYGRSTNYSVSYYAGVQTGANYEKWGVIANFTFIHGANNNTLFSQSIPSSWLTGALAWTNVNGTICVPAGFSLLRIDAGFIKFTGAPNKNLGLDAFSINATAVSCDPSNDYYDICASPSAPFCGRGMMCEQDNATGTASCVSSASSEPTVVPATRSPATSSNVPTSVASPPSTSTIPPALPSSSPSNSATVPTSPLVPPSPSTTAPTPPLVSPSKSTFTPTLPSVSSSPSAAPSIGDSPSLDRPPSSSSPLPTSESSPAVPSHLSLSPSSEPGPLDLSPSTMLSPDLSPGDAPSNEESPALIIHSEGFPVGGIVGVAIGAVVLLGLLVGLVVFLVRRRKKKTDASSDKARSMFMHTVDKT